MHFFIKFPVFSIIGFTIKILHEHERAKVRFSAEARDFSLLHSIQTGPGAHPATCPMGTGGLFLRGKATGV
jgi:hypothetical protein